jgi:hypothetical protein
MARTTPYSVMTFNREGFLTEEVNFDENGKRLCTQSLTRDGPKVLESFQECADRSLSSRSVHTYDANGEALESLVYNGTGALKQKTTYSRPSEGVTEYKVYNGSGTLDEHTITEVDRCKRTRLHQVYRQGKLYLTLRGTWNKEGRWVGDTFDYPNGITGDGSLQRVSRAFTYSPGENGLMLETITKEQNGNRREQRVLRDKSGRVIRDENQEGDTRFVSENDAHQQPSFFAEYDNAGLRSKTTHAYEYDSRGNWIKQSTSVWSRGSNEARLVTITTRRITYH